MNPENLEKCIELAQSIRMGKLYPTAIEIVDAIERVTGELPEDSEISTQMVILIKLVMMRQICHDWLGVADYLEYDLPDVLATQES